jgi:fermentation-respiration switch protein FrsA (DUF1100 family)
MKALHAVLAAVFSAGVLGAGPVTAQAPALEAYAQLPATSGVAVSPDGANLAYIRRTDGAAQVVVQARTGEVLAMVDAGAGIVRDVDWASTDHVLIYSTTNQMVPFYRGRNLLSIVDVLNVRTRRVARVMHDANVAAYNVAFDVQPFTQNGKTMLAVTGVGTAQGLYSLDLFHVDPDTGRGREVIRGGSDATGYLVDGSGNAIAKLSRDSEIGRFRISGRRGMGWGDIRNVVAPLDGPSILGMGRTPGTVALAERIDGKRVVTEVSLTDGSQTSAVEVTRDVQGPVSDRLGRLVGLTFHDEFRGYQFLEPELNEAWATLSQALPGRQLSLVSFSDDMGVIVAHVQGSGESGGYYLYDVAEKRVSLVGREYPGVPGAQMAEVRVVRYKAGDGMDLMGYLTLPPGREARDLPLIMFPHGGPAARDEAGFDYFAQALASRGYAVFQPNFRGSAGLGEEWLEAGYGEWGRKMQSDLSDGLKVLVERGMVDADRVCIVGASYGGYAAMAGMTLDAGTYRCGVAIAGVSDLRAMLVSEERTGGARGGRNPAVRYWTRFMGAAGVNDPSLNERSPAQLAARMRGPLLLIHGRQDTVVPFEQSELMQRAAAAAGKTDVRLVPLAGEDHHLSQPATRLQTLKETVEFLEANNPAT